MSIEHPYTDGPCTSESFGRRAEDGPTSYRIVGPQGETLGFTNGYSALDSANADLWACAPDLLAELEHALAYLDRGVPEPYEGHSCYTPDSSCDGNCMDVAYYGQFWQRARKAIAKARGTAVQRG